MASRQGSEGVVGDMLAKFGRHQIPNKTEQIERGKQVQAMMGLERLRQELTIKAGEPPSDDVLAAEAGLSPAQLRRRLIAGRRARERLVTGNLRMCVVVAKKYRGLGLPLEDLIQEGAIGLQRAVDFFDPLRGYTLGTYAYWWVRQAIYRALAETGDTIRIPTNVLEKLFSVQRHLASSTKPVSDAELMDIADLKTDEQLRLVRAGARAKNCGSTSILMPDEKRSLEELLPCPKSRSDIEEDRLEFSLQLDKLSMMLPHLSEEETKIIELIYLNDIPKTEIAKMLDTTTERVSGIAKQALRKLRRLALMGVGDPVVQQSLF